MVPERGSNLRRTDAALSDQVPEDLAVCEYCRRPLPGKKSTGRPRKFCSDSHRQRAYEARRRAAGLGLGDGTVVVREEVLRDLHDRLYVLEAALEDVCQDTASARTAGDYRAALAHLMEAATGLAGLVVEPATG